MNVMHNRFATRQTQRRMFAPDFNEFLELIDHRLHRIAAMVVDHVVMIGTIVRVVEIVLWSGRIPGRNE